jgi:hypothetical protein
MAGLLVIGFIANFLVKPVDPKFHMSESGEEEREEASSTSASSSSSKPAEA